MSKSSSRAVLPIIGRVVVSLVAVVLILAGALKLANLGADDMLEGLEKAQDHKVLFSPAVPFPSIDQVGSAVAKNLMSKAIIATFFCVVFICLYVWLRFDFWSGVAAIVAGAVAQLKTGWSSCVGPPTAIIVLASSRLADMSLALVATELIGPMGATRSSSPPPPPLPSAARSGDGLRSPREARAPYVAGVTRRVGSGEPSTTGLCPEGGARSA